jgi:tetratricopeptide (TPR) repeat protein
MRNSFNKTAGCISTIGATAIVLSLLPFIVSAQELPDDMKHLEDLTSVHSELVEEAYQYHKAGLESIEEDFKILRKNEATLTNLKRAQLQLKVENIEQVWKFVLTEVPDTPRAINYYGELLFDYLEQGDRGYQYWLRAAQLDPDYPSPQNNLGLLFFHNGQYEKGYGYLKKALDLDPKHPDYLFNMTQMYLTYFPQLGKILDKTKSQLYKDAMKMSEKAAKYAPDDYEIVKSHANNFYVAEDFGARPNWNTAAKTWQKVVELAEIDDDIFHARLNEGRTWIRAGQSQKAKSTLEAALKIVPDSRVAQQLYEKAK